LKIAAEGIIRSPLKPLRMAGTLDYPVSERV
jgi:hypothetical protein